MKPILLLLLGGAGTYVLRLLFITLVPADRFPDRLRSSLQLVGPATLAALVATDIGHSATHPTTLWPTLAAVAVAGLIAALTKNLALTILGGLVAALTVGLIG